MVSRFPHVLGKAAGEFSYINMHGYNDSWNCSLLYTGSATFQSCLLEGFLKMARWNHLSRLQCLYLSPSHPLDQAGANETDAIPQNQNIPPIVTTHPLQVDEKTVVHGGKALHPPFLLFHLRHHHSLSRLIQLNSQWCQRRHLIPTMVQHPASQIFRRQHPLLAKNLPQPHPQFHGPPLRQFPLPYPCHLNQHFLALLQPLSPRHTDVQYHLSSQIPIVRIPELADIVGLPDRGLLAIEREKRLRTFGLSSQRKQKRMFVYSASEWFAFLLVIH
jgi:hypothetical protein